jgi:BirA family biotin operon repressor/biotin-[acetyl-CoA-carboxylase] ligase
MNTKSDAIKRLSELEDYFRSNAYKIGQTIYLYDECTSTQEVAKEMVLKVSNGTCVLATKQTEGKGRLGRKWLSPEGGLWLSIIIKDIQEPAFLNPLLSISAIKLIEEVYGLRPKIYWPNDIYIEGKKVGGILTDGLHNDKSVYICGIGINLNIHKDFFDSTGLSTASSLYVLSGKKVTLLDFLQDFLIKLNFLYELVQMQSFEYIENAFKEYNDLIAKFVKIKCEKEEYTGQVIDISIKDGILLKFSNNIVKNFFPDEVENIRSLEYVKSL